MEESLNLKIMTKAQFRIKFLTPLTQEEKHIAYIILLHEAKKYPKYSLMGLCRLSWITFGINPKKFPELISKSTGRYGIRGIAHHMGGYYFRDWNERRAAIQQCIKETHYE